MFNKNALCFNMKRIGGDKSVVNNYHFLLLFKLHAMARKKSCTMAVVLVRFSVSNDVIMFVIRTVQVAFDKVHKGIQLTIILGVTELAC